MTYDSVKNKARIKYFASDLHEEVTSQFQLVYETSSQSLGAEIKERIRVLGSPSTRLEGKYHHSKSAPDAAFKFRNGSDRGTKLSTVVEVGLSENYEDLCEVAATWLNGKPSIQLVILVKITENPGWTSMSSVGDYELEEAKKLLRSRTLDLEETEPRLDDITDSLTFKGMPLVNAMTVFMELWKRDEDGNPVRSGDRLWYVHDCSDPLLVFDDMFPISKEDGGDLPFALSWKRLGTALVEGRLSFAEDRYGQVRDWVRARQPEITDDDSESQPEEGTYGILSGLLHNPTACEKIQV